MERKIVATDTKQNMDLVRRQSCRGTSRELATMYYAREHALWIYIDSEENLRVCWQRLNMVVPSRVQTQFGNGRFGGPSLASAHDDVDLQSPYLCLISTPASTSHPRTDTFITRTQKSHAEPDEVVRSSYAMCICPRMTTNSTKAAPNAI